MWLDTALLIMAGAAYCCLASLCIGYAGAASGFWTWARRRWSYVDYNSLTPTLYSSDARKKDSRRAADATPTDDVLAWIALAIGAIAGLTLAVWLNT